jgi:GNAT superfamily N-acetyltransferase
MQVATDFRAVFEEFNRIKKQGKSWKTNCFLSEEQVQELIASKNLFTDSGDQWFALVSRGSQFDRFFFAAADFDSINLAVEQLDQSCHDFLVADLVGESSETRQIAAIFRGNGFKDYAVYQRLVRISVPNQSLTNPNTNPVAYAAEEDAKNIYDAIIANFDPFCDHFPSLSEIRRAVSQRSILVSKRHSKLLGFCHFETTGITSLIRYYWVLDSCRGQGIGSNLLQSYFETNFNVRRFILWVNTRNYKALQRYRHFGYQEDQLSDYIIVGGRDKDGQNS